MANYIYYNGQLYHHGIKGMRWGVRRFQDKNGRLTAAGKKRYNDGNSRRDTNQEEEPKKSGLKLTDKQKKAIKVGAAVAVTALAAYGGYKLYQRYGINTTNIGGKLAGALDPKTGLELQSSHNANPLRQMKAVNPNYKSAYAKYRYNCGNCGIAFEARMRGYDVEALGNEKGMTVSQLGQFFKGMSSNTFKEIDMPNISGTGRNKGIQVESAIKKGILDQCKNSDNARGMLFFPGDFGNHWISWVKNGSNVQFVNSQDPRITEKVLREQIFPCYKYKRNSANEILQSVRLDDLEFNGDTIRTVVGNVNTAKITQKAADLGLAEAEVFNACVDRGKDFIMKAF